tara:strand:- start:425 stop:1075 length:651 start_codon:yes stop_codon:yes gene_type:complete
MTKAFTDEESTSARRVVLMDYGVGNLGSVAGALRRLGYRVRASADPIDFEAADAVVLPGVGAMPAAMQTLRQTSLDAVITRLYHEQRVPILGICLGTQLMFQHSDEGDVGCLGLLKGRVRRFSNGSCHVGWSQCPVPAGAEGESIEAALYFNHSYFIDADPSVVTSEVTVEGHGKVAAIVQSGCFVGMQFHPEKSQATGAALLRRFIENTSEAPHA